MVDRSPLDYDVSVSADKRRRARRRAMTGAFDTGGRCCEWPGCGKAAHYRAPRSPERLAEYRWFCLEHVRDYNASWDFFANRSEDEIERMVSGANAWERPTWSLGEGPRGPQGMHPHANGNAWARFGFSDPFEVLGENATLNPTGPAEARPRRRLSRPEQHALDTLGVPHQETVRRAVRARYRALVKQLHPDMNGGENADPERLERVLRAWEVLRKSPNFSD
jgi:hypothetical protein